MGMFLRPSWPSLEVFLLNMLLSVLLCMMCVHVFVQVKLEHFQDQFRDDGVTGEFLLVCVCVCVCVFFSLPPTHWNTHFSFPFSSSFLH